MKTVFNSSEVPHIWALQNQESGRNAHDNFYFKGKTIFSYGGHFPIATIDGENVLFTMRTYSNTTAKHISKAMRAISHKNIIWCYDVPTMLNCADYEHIQNLDRWKREIKSVFAELGNKRIRDTQGRINTINTHIEKLTAYCKYFNLKVKDSELKKLLSIALKPDFIEIARSIKDKVNVIADNKMKLAGKAYEKYLSLWRDFKDEQIKDLPAKIKDLCYFYTQGQNSSTRLRFNTAQNRVETSKGVQIPCEVAKRAFIQLNGCMEGNCKGINVPVLGYTITETGKDYIKAGCHTIPKSDVWYIANLLKWI